MYRYIVSIICMFVLCSCGSKTTVILLPDADGKTGAAEVKNNAASTLLDQPYSFAEVRDADSKIEMKVAEEENIKNEYGTLLLAEPAKPVQFILYFHHDTTRLTTASEALLPEIIETAKSREPSEVSIIGHTDSKGNSEYNSRLALKRAQAVADILKQSDTVLKNMIVTSHGENDPLIKTADNVSEQRNRRVEIIVR